MIPQHLFRSIPFKFFCQPPCCLAKHFVQRARGASIQVLRLRLRRVHWRSRPEKPEGQTKTHNLEYLETRPVPRFKQASTNGTRTSNTTSTSPDFPLETEPKTVVSPFILSLLAHTETEPAQPGAPSLARVLAEPHVHATLSPRGVGGGRRQCGTPASRSTSSDGPMRVGCQ